MFCKVEYIVTRVNGIASNRKLILIASSLLVIPMIEYYDRETTSYALTCKGWSVEYTDSIQTAYIYI